MTSQIDVTFQDAVVPLKQRLVEQQVLEKLSEYVIRAGCPEKHIPLQSTGYRAGFLDGNRTLRIAVGDELSLWAGGFSEYLKQNGIAVDKVEIKHSSEALRRMFD